MFVEFHQQSWRLCKRVIDGDTIVLDGDEVVRLIGVDTPETKDPRKPVEFFAQEAYEFTRELVEGKYMRLEFNQTRIDRYGRTLAYAYLQGGAFVNAEIIKQGYGFAYTKYPFKYMDEFRAYEKAARENNLGLWAQNQTVGFVASPQQDPNVTVYITKSGKKYHRAGCSYVKKSRIPIKLKDAVAKGYTPCSKCNPPTLE
jgi:micrococcal nuclease